MTRQERQKIINKKKNHNLIYLILFIIGLTILYQSRLVMDDSQFMWISVTSYTIIPGLILGISAFFTIKLFKEKNAQTKAFLLFTIGASFIFLAEQTWLIYEYVFNLDPFPSIADIFYISTYPFFISFLLLSLKPIRKWISSKVWIFSILLACSILIPSILASSDSFEGEDTFSISIALLYPILSSIQLVPVIVGLLYLVTREGDYSWMLLFFGFLLVSIADTNFLFAELDGSYFDGHPVDLLYLYSYVFLIFSLKNLLQTSKSNDHKTNGKLFSEKINYEAVVKFTIPLTLLIISLTVLTWMISTIYYNDGKEINFQPIIIGTAALLGTLIVIFMILNQNLTRLIDIKTKKLQKQKEVLEFRVKEKTLALVRYERLLAMGELSNRLAHDLRNPLSVMKLSMELIRNHSKDAKISDPLIVKRLDLIEKSIERISHQVNDVLDYVKESKLNLSLVSIRKLILNSIYKIKVPNNIKIIISDFDVNLTCDSSKLEAVFNNIIMNSIQEMNKGGTIEIIIKLEAEFTVIEFIDSGKGVTPELKDKIFDPLFTTKQRGTGLGLSSCKNIIKQHGGTITFKNDPTTFKITLPNLSAKMYTEIPQSSI